MDKSIPVKFGNFAGMDNVHADNELPHGTLRRAINTDVLDSGKLRRRRGSTLLLASANAHSLWSDGQNAHYVQANQMRQFFANGTSAALGAFAAGANPVSYVKVGQHIYAMCKTARCRITNGVISPWGVEVPSSAPVLMATVGTLPAGTYTACMTYLLADGRESGASRFATITLAVDGGIATTSLPVPLDPAITKKRLYLSSANGETLYMAVELAAIDQFVSQGTPPAGSVLRTQYKSPPPFGTALTYANGIIYIIDAADPTVVWFTDALDYDHVDLRKNYYQFSAPITLIAGVNDGVYFCGDKTYFIAAAGTAEHSQRERLDFGAIAGSAQQIPNTDDVIWMSPHGAVIGHIGGQVELLSKNMVALADMTNGASMIREQNSLRQFVVVGNNKQDSALQAGSYADAEIVRRAAL